MIATGLKQKQQTKTNNSKTHQKQNKTKNNKQTNKTNQKQDFRILVFEIYFASDIRQQT